MFFSMLLYSHMFFFFFFSSRRRHTRSTRDWSSDVCSSDLNVFENNWMQADQDGLAILFTPRNQNGTAPWSTVQDVTFTNNIVRHSTGGINLMGWDDLSTASGQRSEERRVGKEWRGRMSADR